MTQPQQYNGYLASYTPYIHELHKCGVKPSRIAALLYEVGARSLYSEVDGYPRARSVDVLSAIVRYIIYKRDPHGLPVLSKVYKKMGRNQHSHTDRTRPIDMGGRRDHWHVWTPERQYRETYAGIPGAS